MQTDPDRPFTWKKYRQSMCDTCIAACCMLPVEITAADLIRLGLMDAGELSLKKVAKRLLEKKIIRSFRSATGLFMLDQQQDRACIFLGKDRRCTVYEKRPDVCRKFPTEMGPKIGFCPAKEKKQQP